MRQTCSKNPSEKLMTACWQNGSLMAAEQAQISVYDHGLLYGDGVFEGIRFYHGKAFYLDEHLQRLFDSAKVCALVIPYSLEELAQAVNATIDMAGMENGYLRLVVTRGVGGLGIDPRRCERANVFILADHIQLSASDARDNGLAVIVAHTRRLPLDGLDPRVKSLNYLNHILAKIEANHAGADEAILLNQQGHVAEGSADNVFIVKNGRLFTPPLSDGALDGITRSIVLHLARQLGISHEERSLGVYDLYVADECFLSGTAMEIIPVRSVDQRKLNACPGPVYRRLQHAFRDLIDNPDQRLDLAEAVS